MKDMYPKRVREIKNVCVIHFTFQRLQNDFEAFFINCLD